MVYNWDGKEDECRRLYVEEKKSLDVVMQYWQQQRFTPSKRAFQSQFKRWGFGKQNPAYKNSALTARVKELWERNTSQKDMLDVLQAERFEINDRELMRVRSRFNWYIREKRKKDNPAPAKGKTDKKVELGTRMRIGLIDQLTAAILQEADSSEEQKSEGEGGDQEESESDNSVDQSIPPLDPEPLDPKEALRRQARKRQLQTESDEKWQARKGRRRTRGWAGLPADVPGEPPRFPSETTLDESKAYLDLDNKLYAQIRDEFQVLCEEQGVIKKTVAGPEKWAELLQRLVRENHHLSTVFMQQPGILQQTDAFWKPKDLKTLSLDIVCQDVTKRMRVTSTRMSIPEAKNTLHLNPAQTREAKKAFLAILRADHFTSKTEAGGQHWDQLKQRWVSGCELLQRALAPGVEIGHGERAQRLRAIEVLARDVVKRRRAETTRKGKEDGRFGKAAHNGPGPGPAKPSSSAVDTSSSKSRSTQPSNTAPITHDTTLRTASQSQPRNMNNSSPPTEADIQIDPSLLLAASSAALPPHHSTTDVPIPTNQTQPQAQHTGHSFYNALDLLPGNNTRPSATTHVNNAFLHPLPVSFRPHT